MDPHLFPDGYLTQEEGIPNIPITRPRLESYINDILQWKDFFRAALEFTAIPEYRRIVEEALYIKYHKTLQLYGATLGLHEGYTPVIVTDLNYTQFFRTPTGIFIRPDITVYDWKDSGNMNFARLQFSLYQSRIRNSSVIPVAFGLSRTVDKSLLYLQTAPNTPRIPISYDGRITDPGLFMAIGRKQLGDFHSFAEGLLQWLNLPNFAPYK